MGNGIRQTPIEYMALPLLQFEVEKSLGDIAYKQFYRLVRDNSDINAIYLSSVAKKALENNNNILFAEKILESTLLLKKVKQSTTSTIKKNIDLEIAVFLKDSFVKAMVSLLERNEFSQDIIITWKNILNKNGYHELDDWLEAVGGILISKEIDADDIMQRIFVDIKEDEILRQVAALSIMCDDSSNPAMVLECQSFMMARYILLSKPEVEFLTSFGKLFKKVWNKIIKSSFSNSQNHDKIENIEMALKSKLADVDDIIKIVTIMKSIFSLPSSSMTGTVIAKYSNKN